MAGISHEEPGQIPPLNPDCTLSLDSFKPYLQAALDDAIKAFPDAADKILTISKRSIFELETSNPDIGKFDDTERMVVGSMLGVVSNTLVGATHLTDERLGRADLPTLQYLSDERLKTVPLTRETYLSFIITGRLLGIPHAVSEKVLGQSSIPIGKRMAVLPSEVGTTPEQVQVRFLLNNQQYLMTLGLDQDIPASLNENEVKEIQLGMIAFADMISLVARQPKQIDIPAKNESVARGVLLGTEHSLLKNWILQPAEAILEATK